MITVTQSGAICIDGKESIDMYCMLVLKSALKLEMVGIRVSRHVRAFKIAKEQYGMKGNKQKIYADFCALCEQAGAAHIAWQQQEVAKSSAIQN
jgi:hypothetical protein